MMSACIAKQRGIGRGSAHNSSPTQVLERSTRLSKDEMILRLGDGKAVPAEAVGSLDSRQDEVLLEESSETPQQNHATSFEPLIPTDGVPVLRISTRESGPPETHGEAISDIDSSKWLKAIKSEMDSIGSNQVWSLIDPPKGLRSVGCKWVYKRKLGADEEVTAFKARLVAKAYTERSGVNFEETYLPMDIKTAFLNGFFEEEIFMDQLEGFTFIGEEQKNEHDPCVYKKISGSSVAYLVLYVHDILLIGNDVKMLCDIKSWLSTQFSMKNMGEACYILGIKTIGIDLE
ncbi:UNVERIFIED_CONTAM: Retrovirus-related Pol polyprotein from transposon RE1 [Sesamum calycinum]|uniref:Retrovirus-related Pol polyprotein from transposon RE1 n=1 Tax=Sesamum calycinum TaxID=2727403 RepID=A0AAW2RPE1_9LAMI